MLFWLRETGQIWGFFFIHSWIEFRFTPFYHLALRAGGVLSSRFGRAGDCQTCRTHMSVTAWWIFSIRSSVELSRPVVVHWPGLNHGISGFEKAVYQEWEGRYGHGTIGTWIDRMLIPLCDLELWSWPWTFKVKSNQSHIPRMGGSINMGRKGCESIGCWTQYVTLIFNLTHDLEFGFSRLNFQIAIAQDWKGQLTWNGRGVSQIRLIMRTLTCNMGLPV